MTTKRDCSYSTLADSCCRLVVLPYLWCRFEDSRFRDGDADDQLKVYLSRVLYWNGGLGIFVAPFLLIGWLPLFPSLLFGWAGALGLTFAGCYLDRRLTKRLSKKSSQADLED